MMSMIVFITQRTHLRSLRVSVYQGARVHGAFSKKYLVGIEDPFNNEDNPARTVGSTVGSRLQRCWYTMYSLRN